MKKQPTKEQLRATNKVYQLRETMSDDHLHKLLGISKVTMYTRLKESNWTDSNILMIEYVFSPNFTQIVDSFKILTK